MCTVKFQFHHKTKLISLNRGFYLLNFTYGNSINKDHYSLTTMRVLF